MSVSHKPLDQQAVVVFGASSGIGRATALMAAERGAQVLATGRDQPALDTLMRDAVNLPGRLEVAVAEAADLHQVEAVAKRAVELFGRLDTWAHVAGISAYGVFQDIEPEEFRRVIDVTLLGPVWGARAALPYLRDGGGAYVVVSSEIAKRGFPLATPYSAAKHGVAGFVEALRVELQHDRVPVTVTQIMPGAVSTPFFEHARTRLGVRPSGPPPVYSPETIAESVLHAAEHGGRDVTVGLAPKAQLALQRVSPRIMDAFTRATAFRVQKSKEAKGPEDDALFEAPHGDDRIRGVVTTTHR